MAGTAADECDDLRRALAEARDQAARAEGRRAAEAEARLTPPPPAPVAAPEPSQPTLVDRLASIFE